MADKLDNSAPFDDDQGTKISRESEEKTSSTDAGSEATSGMEGKPKGSSHTYRSAYGGDGGEPKLPNDIPHSRR